MAPALLVCWIEGGAGFFLFSVLRRRRRATGSIAAGTWRRRPSPGCSMSSSLSRFSGWRSRSLSLGEGLTDSTGARDGTRAAGVLDRGRRRLFSFLAFCGRRRRATGSIAAGTWRRRPSPGYSMSSSLSRFSGWRSRSLSLGEGLTDSTGARDGTRADGVLDRGRRRLFSF